MKNFVVGALAALGILAASGAAMADTTLTYDSGGKSLFRVSVPDFWTARVGGPRTLTPPGGDEPRNIARVLGLTPEGADNVWVGFIVPEAIRTIEEGAEYVRDVGPQLVRDVEVGNREKRRIGGREAHLLSGTGRRNGKSVHFTAVLIDLPGPHVAFSVTVLESGYDPVLLEGINAIYDSFRAM